MKRVEKGMFNFDGDEWKNVSNEAKSFIRKMLEMDVNKRYDAHGCLEDPWVKKY